MLSFNIPYRNRSVKYVVFLSIVLSYGLGIAIVRDPREIIFAVSAVVLAVILFQKMEFLLLALVIVTSGFFGIFSQTVLPHVRLPAGMGMFHIGDILLILAFLRAFHEFYFHRAMGAFSTLDKAMMALYGLIILEAALNLIQGVELKPFLGAFRTASYYALYFIMRNTITQKKQLQTLWKGLIIVAVISSLYTHIQFFFDIQLGGSKIEYLSEFGGLPRTYPRGGGTTRLVWNISLLVLLMGYRGTRLKRTGLLVLLGVCLGVLLTTFARASWSFTLVTIALYALITLFITRRLSVKNLLLLGILATIFLYAWNQALTVYTVGGLDILVRRMFSGIAAVTYRTGSLASRLEILSIKWNDMLDYNPVLGHGFDWGGTTTPSSYAPYGRTADSGLASLLTVFGIAGPILFGIIYLILIRKCFRIMRRSSDIWVRSLSVMTMVGIILAFPASLFGDSYFAPSSVVMTMGVWAVLELLDRQTRET